MKVVNFWLKIVSGILFFLQEGEKETELQEVNEIWNGCFGKQTQKTELRESGYFVHAFIWNRARSVVVKNFR